MRHEPVIRLIEVSKSFGAGERAQRVLDGVNLDIVEGTTTVIAGASGQGKSVTLKLILGLLAPDRGNIEVSGREVGRMGAGELREMRTEFGVLFQGSALFDSLTVFENIALPLKERARLKAGEIRERVMRTLEQLDMAGHEDKYPAQLSGGMKKRVGLARALQMQPRIMLFDEPTTGLDPARSMEIYQLFYRTQKEFGYTSIIVSHDIPRIFDLADRVAILHDGKMWTFDSPEAILLSGEPLIQDFVTLTMGEVYRSGQVETL